MGTFFIDTLYVYFYYLEAIMKSDSTAKSVLA